MDEQLSLDGSQDLCCEHETQRSWCHPCLPPLLPRGGKSHSVQVAPPQIWTCTGRGLLHPRDAPALELPAVKEGVAGNFSAKKGDIF